MATPSEALRKYLGVQTPEEQDAEAAVKNQIWKERQIAAAFNRDLALAKARAARAEQAKQRASTTRHLHPADDPWTRTCRTLCGVVVKVEFALAPVASALRGETWKQHGCHRCEGLWAAWRLFGNGKPLTYRRLNKWTDEEKNMRAKDLAIEADGTVVIDIPKKGRELALEKALEVLMHGAKEMDRDLREAAANIIIGLIAFETAAREGRSAFPDYPGDETTPAMTGEQRTTMTRRAWHVELVRMNLPAAVLKALRGL